MSNLDLLILEFQASRSINTQNMHSESQTVFVLPRYIITVYENVGGVKAGTPKTSSWE